MTEQPRRIRQYVFTPEVFLSLQRGAYRVVGHELPKDAKRVGAGYDSRQDVFWVNVESAEFREILPACEIPVCEAALIEALEQMPLETNH